MPSGNNQKIPCSVGIITLNNESTLRRTLESVKDFAEIIICDGNSTDATISIAKEFGCRIIPQYETIEKNISIKDKSVIRNKTISAATYPWYFYIDSDDQVTPELVDHIRIITTSNNPQHLVWKANCKIKVGNKVYAYSASYPDYRTVLFHQSTQAYWEKPEHEVIRFDIKKYSAGMLDGYMYLCWDESRLGKNYWINAQRWLERDFQYHKTKKFKNFWHDQLIYNILAAGGFSYRSMKQYLIHGFNDSMPIQVEVYRVTYQLMLLWKFSLYYFFSIG